MLIIVPALMAVVIVLLGAGGWAAVNFRPGGHYFDSNGVSLYYTDRGAGEPLILLHGFGLTSRTGWELRGVSGALAQHYRVIALDQRGHGLSGKPHDASQYGEEMARDVVRLMDHLKLPRAHVVGYSMGGFVTLKLVTMFPDRIITAGVCGAGFEAPAGKNLTVVKAVADSLREGTGFAPLARALEPHGAEPNRAKLAVMNWYLSAENDVIALAAVSEAFPRFAVTEEAARTCKVPVISIVGADDPLRPGVEALHKIMPGHELVVVPDANHMTTVHRAEFRGALLDFLGRHATKLDSPAKTALESAHAHT